MFKSVKALLILWFSCCFGELSLEDKVGQLLMVHFRGEEVNEEARMLVQEVKVGAVIYYAWANGLASFAKVQALSQGLQELAQIPLLIAVDQEGGKVSRLPFAKSPSNREIGESGDPQRAKEAARAVGKALLAAGVNMNLAPVVDVDSNPDNPVIGARSFGKDPKMVALFGGASLEGFREAGLVATLKHFPGYGDVSVDPHQDLPILYKTQEELEAVELFPFAQLCPFADAVMTAHILVPSLDKEACATCSEKILRYLREQLGFEGVIVADSLVMEGVLKLCGSVEEAAIRAVNAGCDLLILGGKAFIDEVHGVELTAADVQRIHRALADAVKTGRISEERLNQAVARILKLKRGLLCHTVSIFHPIRAV